MASADSWDSCVIRARRQTPACSAPSCDAANAGVDSAESCCARCPGSRPHQARHPIRPRPGIGTRNRGRPTRCSRVMDSDPARQAFLMRCERATQPSTRRPSKAASSSPPKHERRGHHPLDLPGVSVSRSAARKPWKRILSRRSSPTQRGASGRRGDRVLRARDPLARRAPGSRSSACARRCAIAASARHWSRGRSGQQFASGSPGRPADALAREPDGATCVREGRLPPLPADRRAREGALTRAPPRRARSRRSHASS